MQRYAELRFAFSRPGFLTFKLTEPANWTDRFELTSTFARTYGLSLTNLHETDGDRMLQSVLAQLRGLNDCRHIHIFQRDLFLPGDKNFEPGQSELANVIGERLVERLGKTNDGKTGDKAHIHVNEIAEPNAHVLDIVIVEPDRWLIGHHRAATIVQRWPGGVPDLEMRDDIISRAYYKMLEALLWSQLPLNENDQCVEIGSAPGGACQALIELGAKVVAIDPADMHPSIAQHEQLVHLKKRSKDVRKSELSNAKWLFADMNVAPNYTLDAAEEIVTNQKTGIQGMLLTLKIGDWKMADTIGEMINRVKGWGYRYVKTRQLAFNRREICLMALKNKAVRRM